MNHYAYVTEIYCENPDCNVRQCQIYTKELDGPDVKQWHCPACWRLAKVHWRRNLREQSKIDLENALGLVNAALYRRDEDSDAFPAGLLMLSKLPDAWKHVNPSAKGTQ